MLSLALPSGPAALLRPAGLHAPGGRSLHPLPSVLLAIETGQQAAVMFPKLPASPEHRDLRPEGVMGPALSFRVLSVNSLPTWKQSTAQVSGLSSTTWGTESCPCQRLSGLVAGLPGASPHIALWLSAHPLYLSCTSGVFNSSVPWVLCSVSLLLHRAPHSCALKWTQPSSPPHS